MKLSFKSNSIFEINTRVWIRRFDDKSSRANLSSVPDAYWDILCEKGIDFIWLMGIWKVCKSSIGRSCFEPGLVRNYNKALKDWTVDDVIGSPYAIDKYEINPEIGTREELAALKEKINARGMKLILDFVPNHFNVDTSLLKEKPRIFLGAAKELYMRDDHTFFQPFHDEENYYAHGRDPFFPAWQDTVQVNYFSPEARDYMTNILVSLSSVCDGVRCDMAMLSLKNVFRNTWRGVLDEGAGDQFNEEFWETAIRETRKKNPEFIFIAEAYWDMEWTLQQMGFDYTYDKKMTDRLRGVHPLSVVEHLKAEPDYQYKSVRFIENHDEERALASFGAEKSKAAAVIISTVPGLRFYHDGQFEGKKIKLPVQLRREPFEHAKESVAQFYEKLLSITKSEIFRSGEWKLLLPVSSWDGNDTYKNMLAWQWSLNNEKMLVVVNYSPELAASRIKLDLEGYPEEFEIRDLLNDQKYTRSAEESYHQGLYVELKGYQSHIFSF